MSSHATRAARNSPPLPPHPSLTLPRPHFLSCTEFLEADVGSIYRVAGPLVIAERMTGAAMYELVKVG